MVSRGGVDGALWGEEPGDGEPSADDVRQWLDDTMHAMAAMATRLHNETKRRERAALEADELMLRVEDLEARVERIAEVVHSIARSVAGGGA